MRITRLHLILIVVLSLALALHFVQKRASQKALKANLPEKIAVQQLPQAQPEPEKKSDSESIARKTIAIGGEYWKIAKKENRYLLKGQMMLREAKKRYAAGSYDEAIELAAKSIEELKNARKVGIKYTVKRRDNLWNIAKMKQHYGRGAMWVKIWRANESIIPDFSLIYSGQLLLIPK